MVRIRNQQRRVLNKLIFTIFICVSCYLVGSICGSYFAPVQRLENGSIVYLEKRNSGHFQQPYPLHIDNFDNTSETKSISNETDDQLADLRQRNVQLALTEVLRVLENAVSSIPDPKTIFVVSTWRSGSTFFAEVINSHPAVYYHYEPWTNYEASSLHRRNSPDLKEALETVDHLKNCNYFNVSKYLQVASNDGSMLNRNDKLHHACDFLDLDCYDPVFLTKVCQYFPIQLFKFVKANIRDFKPLMSDPQVYVILLLRDPRAVYASRQQLDWCQADPYCINVSKMCKFLEENLEDAKQLSQDYPERTLIISFEEMAEDPSNVFKKIFQDLHIPWDRQVERFLNEHTSKNIDEPWSTFRIPKERISKWNETLAPLTVKEIEASCQAFMKEYKSFV